MQGSRDWGAPPLGGGSRQVVVRLPEAAHGDVSNSQALGRGQY